MTEKNPQYTEKDYPRLCVKHFLCFLFLCGLAFLGHKVSGKERGDEKTPYFLPAVILAGTNVLYMLFSLFVVICTRTNARFDKTKVTLNKVLAWYNLWLNFGCMYTLVGLVLALGLGCCKGERCYAQTNVAANICIAVVIAIAHLVSFFWFGILSSHIRCIRKLSPNPSPQAVNVKPINDEADTNDSKNNLKKKEETKTANAKSEKKPLEGPVVDAGRLPFAVLAKSLAKLKQTISPNKSSPISTEDIDVYENSSTRQFHSRDPQHPPSHESVVGNGQKEQRKPDVENNLYHIPPLPDIDIVNSASLPDNSGDSFPDSHIFVIQSKNS